MISSSRLSHHQHESHPTIKLNSDLKLKLKPKIRPTSHDVIPNQEQLDDRRLCLVHLMFMLADAILQNWMREWVSARGYHHCDVLFGVGD